MLLNLPNEVILPISSYLPLEDKINLITTCHKLHDLISKTNLYQDLNLYKDWKLKGSDVTSKKIAEGIVEKFENKHFDGSQVKRLQIVMDDLSSHQQPRISDIFPAVTECTSFRGERFANCLEESIVDPLVKWKDTLEVYKLRSYRSDLPDGLKTETFPRLTKLELGYTVHTRRWKKDGFDPLHFLPLLKSTPSLKRLELDRCDINLEFLEQVHANCPHLESLILTDVIAVVDQNSLPESILPAKGLLELTLHKLTILDPNALFLDYIVSKYTNLSSLSMSLYECSHDGVFEWHISGYYKDLINDPFFDEIGYSDAEIEDSKLKVASLLADFKATQQVYPTAGHKFLSRLPKTLRILDLQYGTFDSILDPLALSNSNLISLKVDLSKKLPFEILQKQIQPDSLKKLAHLNTLITRFHSKLLQHFQDVASTSITKLYLDLESGDLYIDSLLSSLPSLEELYIEETLGLIKGIGGGKENNKQLKLRYLSIKATIVYQDTIDAFKEMAPNLQNVELIIKDLSRKVIGNLDFSDWHLEKCSISIDAPKKHGQYIAFNITISNLMKQLILGPFYGHLMLVPPNHLVQLKSITPKDALRFNLTHRNIQNLRIQNYLIKSDGKNLIVLA